MNCFSNNFVTHSFLALEVIEYIYALLCFNYMQYHNYLFYVSLTIKVFRIETDMSNLSQPNLM